MVKATLGEMYDLKELKFGFIAAVGYYLVFTLCIYYMAIFDQSCIVLIEKRMMYAGIVSCIGIFFALAFCSGAIFGTRPHETVYRHSTIVMCSLLLLGYFFMTQCHMGLLGALLILLGLWIFVGMIIGAISSKIFLLWYCTDEPYLTVRTKIKFFFNYIKGDEASRPFLKSDSTIRKRIQDIVNSKRSGSDNNGDKKKNDQSNKQRVVLIARRKELGLTQGEFAQALGVNVNTICALESRISYDPRLSLVKKVCEAYDDTVENLFWSE